MSNNPNQPSDYMPEMTALLSFERDYLDKQRTAVANKINSTIWPIHSSQMKLLFGLKPEQKWPAEGMALREIAGYKIWVNPLPQNHSRRDPKTHRVRVKCPTCWRTMSAGRVHQHQKGCKP